jgi:histidinol-phosphatase (PHP family)
MWSPKNSLYREIDSTPEIFRAILEEDFGGNIREFVERYYSYLAELLKILEPTILGHLDLIKKNNPDSLYFKESEPWYQRSVRALYPTSPQARAHRGGEHGRHRPGQNQGSVSQSLDPLRTSKRRYPIMINTDAHSPELLDAYIEEARYIVRDAGYRKLWLLRPSGWTTQSLEG